MNSVFLYFILMAVKGVVTLNKYMNLSTKFHLLNLYILNICFELNIFTIYK